jgi:hypothetical protein
MAATSGIAEKLERNGPVAGDAGGLVLFAWWMFAIVRVPLPWAVSAVVWLLAMVLVSCALVGYQLRQVDSDSAWLGWAALSAVVIGFAANFWWVPAGLALFGISVVRSKVFPTLPGVLMSVGGWVVLVTSAAAPDGVSGSTPSALAWRGALSVGLILVAGAFADLDALTDPDPLPRAER